MSHFRRSQIQPNASKSCLPSSFLYEHVSAYERAAKERELDSTPKQKNK